MKRKVNQVGTGTLTISLPVNWVKDNNIRKGDELDLLVKGKELRLGSASKTDFMSTQISLTSNNSRYIFQIIRNLYLIGFDEIKINYKDNKILSTIQEVSNKLIGFEIEKKKKNNCTIKNLSTGIETQIDPLLRRIFLLNKSLFETTIDQITNKEFEINNILNLRDNIKKLLNLYRRIITKKKVFSPIKNRSIYIILIRISMICDNIVYSHKYLTKNKDINNFEILLKYIKEVSQMYNFYYTIFYSKKLEQVDELNNLREKLVFKDFIKICQTKQTPKEIIPALHYYAEIARLIATNAGAMISFHST